jgi:hypothetical protein
MWEYPTMAHIHIILELSLVFEKYRTKTLRVEKKSYFKVQMLIDLRN